MVLVSVKSQMMKKIIKTRGKKNELHIDVHTICMINKRVENNIQASRKEYKAATSPTQ